MKRLLAVLFLAALISCDKKENASVKGSINISILNNSENARVSEEISSDVSAVFVSIRNEEGELVYNLARLNLVKVGEEYVSSAIELEEGSYTLEDFLVVNDQDSALYLTPKQDSEFASLINNPLPITFEVIGNATNNINVEVLSVTFGSIQEFGYTTFSFNVINTLNVGLIAAYDFNGNLIDKSGNNLDGTITGAMPAQNRNGEDNKALYFDGEDNLITFPFDSAYAHFPQSFSFWVKFDALSLPLFQMDDWTDSPSGVFFSVGQSTETFHKIAFAFANGEVATADARRTYIADQTLVENTWYHIVAVIESTSSMNIYINGELQTGFYRGNATNMVHTGGNGRMGGPWIYSDTEFKGFIDDMKIYSRILLPQEVEKLYNQ